MMAGGSLWPIIASLAAQGAPEAAAEPAPPPAAEEPALDELTPPPPPVDWKEMMDDDLVTQIIEGRRRPGYTPDLPDQLTQDNVGALRPPPPEAFPGIEDQLPVPDRWRLIETLGVVKERWFDPYHQNVLKGDRAIDRSKVPWLPIKGDDWFFVANLVSDSVFEPRTFPIPNGVQTTERPGSLDVFGKNRSFVAAQTFIAGFALIKGSTAFKPPDVEYRLTLAYQANYVDVPERRVLDVRPSKASHRFDHFIGVQEAFIDKHLGNTSDRYDFYSIRLGIQPFQSDFRGFLFNDSQLGIRLFGNRDNNRFQYNLAAFWRLEKDTNSGLNDITQTPRDDFIFTGNLYRQDFPFVGLTSQVSVTYNMNREKNDIHIDHNGFPVRPALLGDLRGREYDVVYLGYSADGRIGRINLTASFYAALGEDRNSFFTSKPAEIRAGFGAVELSYDHDWMRFRLSGLYATGDGDPYNNTEGGFDAIFENPIFGGADTSYWIRQTIPFAGGGRVISINGRNGILNSLRSSKEEGQSNFNNPGTIFLGAGADFDLTPEFRLSTNLNHLWFENTSSLQVLRSEGSIPKDIGWDLSLAAIWRPKATQNIVGRLSAAVLLPGKGFKDLFENKQRDDAYLSILANVIVSF
ncbi:hypothetical protein [Sphingopyxis macrogoltabida]|uniref:Alginate export domain-containing protein n=1 Tax=Sphingopyxis macrogoltabida TaxID=33050 RepID=A0A0N7GT24_SPHMC|nr:hypothetical protein [Sphingopyxis macrogoltabida]ALH82323.1 hypothetical protein AN936_18795 [Sphingopyxis macrogoltabida]